MVYRDKITSGESVVVREVKTSKKEQPKVKVVPMVNNKPEEEKVDLDTPIQGLCVESNPENAQDNPEDEDDEIDTNVNPNDKIKLNPSIAINQASNQLTSALGQAVDRASNSGIEDNDPTDRFFTQAQNMTNNNPYSLLDTKIEKKNNIFGKAVYEGTNYTYHDDDINITMEQKSKKLELGGVFSSKSDKTKVAFFASGTKTKTDFNSHLSKKAFDINSQDELNNDDVDIDVDNDKDTPPDTANDLMSENSYSAYIAARQNLNNGDRVQANAYHIKDGSQMSKTTSLNANYYLKKFGASIQASTVFYKSGDEVSTNKTNISCDFNPDISEDMQQQENVSNETETIAEEATADQPDNTQKNNKKWRKNFSPFIDTDAIEGTTEEGLGVKAQLKRIGSDSTIAFRAFGKGSTTQVEENSLYHITSGVGMTYKKNIGAKSLLKANVDIKDKVTFGQGNIFTAQGNINYTSPKVYAEVEGKYIKVPNSHYTGIVGRVSYTPNKHVNLFGEASYLNWKYPEGKLNGNSVQVGALVNF